MNRQLFRVNNAGRRPLLIALLILLLLIGGGFIYAFKNQKSFLPFHDHKEYNPLNQAGQGFYGKVDLLLDKALKDRTASRYKIDNLNTLYRRLRFSYPADSNYLVSADDIRLVGFTPDSNDAEETEFYFNSAFKELMDKQESNPTQKYFTIRWNARKDSILSISIDTTLYKLALLPNSWKGRIAFEDPFSAIDTSVAYIRYDNNEIPLYTSSVNPAVFRNSECQWVDLPLSPNSKYGIGDFEKMYDSIRLTKSPNGTAVRLQFPLPGNPAEYSLKLLNTGNKVFIRSHLLDIDFQSGSAHWHTGHDTLFELPAHFPETVLSGQLRGTRKPFSLKLFSSTPYLLASKPLNQGYSNERLDMAKSPLDLFARQEITQVENAMPATTAPRTLVLSTNVLLSKYLEDKIKEKVTALTKDPNFNLKPTDIFEMSVCLLDMSTGEVIAAPFYSNEFEKNNIDELYVERNFNFIKHDIGSTFKPLLSFAAALKFPSLADFQLLPSTTRYAVDDDPATPCYLLGYRTSRYGMKMINHIPTKKPIFWSDHPIGREEFLYRSHDNYPLALTLLALTEAADTQAYRELTSSRLNNTSVNDLIRLHPTSRLLSRSADHAKPPIDLGFKDLGESSFINLLANLYDIDPESRFDTADDRLLYNIHHWDSLNGQARLDGLYEDQVSLNTQLFAHSELPSTPEFRRFESFVLGQGDNQWTNIQLAEAYARLLSRTDVKATFLRPAKTVRRPLVTDTSRLFDYKSSDTKFDEPKLTAASAYQTWKAFITDWQAAVQKKWDRQLLRPAYDVFVAAHGEPYSFFCKTGTPQENPHDNTRPFNRGKDKQIWWDEGLFAFGICDGHQEFPKGITGVIYIKHLSLSHDPTKPGVESSTARDFLTREIMEKILFYNKNRFQ